MYVWGYACVSICVCVCVCVCVWGGGGAPHPHTPDAGVYKYISISNTLQLICTFIGGRV